MLNEINSIVIKLDCVSDVEDKKKTAIKNLEITRKTELRRGWMKVNFENILLSHIWECFSRVIQQHRLNRICVKSSFAPRNIQRL